MEVTIINYRKANLNEIDILANLLKESFIEYPLFALLKANIHKGKKYENYLLALYKLLIKLYIKFGICIVVEKDNIPVGIALLHKKDISLFKYIIHGGVSLLKYVSIYNILSFFVFNDKTTEYLRKNTDLDWYLMLLAVSPNYQGQNIGSEFLVYLDSFIIDNGGKSLSFVTNIEKNMHFYSKNNYENVDYKVLDFRGKKIDNWSFRKIYK